MGPGEGVGRWPLRRPGTLSALTFLRGCAGRGGLIRKLPVRDPLHEEPGWEPGSKIEKEKLEAQGSPVFPAGSGDHAAPRAGSVRGTEAELHTLAPAPGSHRAFRGVLGAPESPLSKAVLQRTGEGHPGEKNGKEQAT